MWETVHLVGFYHKNISRCTVRPSECEIDCVLMRRRKITSPKLNLLRSATHIHNAYKYQHETTTRGSGSHISRQSAHEAGKVVSSGHRPPLTAGNILVLSSVTGWVNTRPKVRLEGLSSSFLLLLLLLLFTPQPWVGLGLFNNSIPLLSILDLRPPTNNFHPL